MEKKLYHRGAALTLYDELDDGTGGHCSRQEEDGAALVLFYMKNHLADAYIPGVWWISHEGCSDEELTTYGDYLRRHNRELCHFALDIFFDTGMDVDLKLPPDVAPQIMASLRSDISCVHFAILSRTCESRSTRHGRLRSHKRIRLMEVRKSKNLAEQTDKT